MRPDPISASVARRPVEPLPLGESPHARRLVHVDLARFGQPGAELLVYDPEEVLRPLRARDLAAESELSVGVRLVISEVGADRLVGSEHGLDEAIGVLQTVWNRLDPTHANPSDVPRAPHFPGCGPDGTFITCANPGEYHGLRTWRGLAPDRHVPEPLLLAAADVAVTAWFAAREGLVEVAAGSTSYVHRCGGTAYGLPTPYCDAHLGRPDRDLPGAHPHTGPLLFKRPSEFDPTRGYYRLAPGGWVDWAPRLGALPLEGAPHPG